LWERLPGFGWETAATRLSRFFAQANSKELKVSKWRGAIRAEAEFSPQKNRRSNAYLINQSGGPLD
jgi:hypothetical protein